MLAAKRSAGVAPQVNCPEHVTCMPLPSVNKTDQFSFETQRRHHQKSKTGVSVAPQKGLIYILQKVFQCCRDWFAYCKNRQRLSQNLRVYHRLWLYSLSVKNRLHLPFLPMRSTSRRDLTLDNPHHAIPKGAFKCN